MRVGARVAVYMAWCRPYAARHPINLIPPQRWKCLTMSSYCYSLLFFGVVFGPVVGFFTGAIGNTIGDLISGYGIVWFWEIGNGLVGLIAGLAVYLTFGRYNNARNIIIAEIFSAIGIVVGIAFAAYSDIWVYKLTFAGSTSELVAAAGTDLINGLILLPILLIIYNAAMRRTGRA